MNFEQACRILTISPRAATLENSRKNFRALIRKCHPDVNSDSEQDSANARVRQLVDAFRFIEARELTTPKSSELRTGEISFRNRKENFPNNLQYLWQVPDEWRFRMLEFGVLQAVTIFASRTALILVCGIALASAPSSPSVKVAIANLPGSEPVKHWLLPISSLAFLYITILRIKSVVDLWPKIANVPKNYGADNVFWKLRLRFLLIGAAVVVCIVLLIRGLPKL